MLLKGLSILPNDDSVVVLGEMVLLVSRERNTAFLNVLALLLVLRKRALPRGRMSRGISVIETHVQKQTYSEYWSSASEPGVTQDDVVRAQSEGSNPSNPRVRHFFEQD
jgi:hypothetical protein